MEPLGSCRGPSESYSSYETGMMRWIGVRTALPDGRTECVPPRKPPFVLCQGSRGKTNPAWTVLAAEGRAPHARLAGFASTRGSPR